VNWDGCTKAEIEDGLLARVAECKARYESLMAIQADLLALVSDVEAGSGDGTFAAAQAAAGARDLLKVGLDYRDALKQFTDFTVDGKLPDD